MDIPADHVRLGQLESERLIQYLATLPPVAWAMPSACECWQVADVVAHLTWEAEVYAESITRGLQGNTSPWEGFPPAGTAVARVTDGLVGQLAVSLRARLADQLLSTYIVRDTQLNDLMAGLSAAEGATLCYHPFGLWPAHDFIGVKLRKVAMHSWDIRSRLEPSAHLSVESIPVFLTVLPRLVRVMFQPAALPATPVRYRFALTGVAARTTDIVVADGTARVAAPEPLPADVTFHCDTEAFVLWLYGRLQLHTALADGRITMEGNQALAAVLAR